MCEKQKECGISGLWHGKIHTPKTILMNDNMQMIDDSFGLSMNLMSLNVMHTIKTFHNLPVEELKSASVLEGEKHNLCMMQ